MSATPAGSTVIEATMPRSVIGRWISGYYCAPLGDVLRGMLPLAAEIRRGKVYSLTDSGRDAARQLLLDQ